MKRRTTYLLACLLACTTLTTCRRQSVEIVSAEFQDKQADGVARQDESIVITLSAPLPADVPLEKITVHVGEGPFWTAAVEPMSDENPKKFRIRIETGTPTFQLQGIYGVDPGAAGVGLDLGRGEVEWVDLQPRRSLPVLQEVIWEDRPEDEGNRVVDQGDWLRLVFDRPVKLTGGLEPRERVITSRDVILSKANDRLDDGNVRAYFAEAGVGAEPETGAEEKGEAGREIRIVLGSGPVLQIDGEVDSEADEIERFQLSAPSGLALNGTEVLPMPKITDGRGGPGAISKRELDIRFPDGFALPRARPNEFFTAPPARMFHTVTSAEGSAYVIGGQAVGGDVLDQVLVYNPFHDKVDGEPFTACEGKLAHPAMQHTATALAGPDGFLNTADDIVVVIGGSDGTTQLGDITVIRRRGTEIGDVTVFALDEKLVVPRQEHAAVAVDANTVLVDGGFGREGGIVGCAERLTFRFTDDKVELEDHAAFRTLARMQHTLTLLPRTRPGDETLVLAYGGYGYDRRRLLQPRQRFGEPVTSGDDDLYFSYFKGSVLVSPILLNVRNPGRVTELRPEFNVALLRRQHVAAHVLPAAAAGSALPVADTVLIAGGTSSDPRGRNSGPRWEMPPLPTVPQGHETASAVLFRFNRDDPTKSRFKVIQHPAPDPGEAPERVFLTAVSVPGYGVVLAGGEPSGDWDKRPFASSVEVFLSSSERLANAAAWLSAPRARAGGYLVREQGVRSVFLIGGLAGDGKPSLSAVEEIPLAVPPGEKRPPDGS